MYNCWIWKYRVANIELFEQVAATPADFFEQTWVDYTTLKADSLRLMPIHEAEW
jgi:hypothetical protein